MSRFYINMTGEEIEIAEGLVIPAQEGEIVVAEISESLIDEDVEAMLAELCEHGVLSAITVVEYGSPEAQEITKNATYKEVDAEEFKNKWYKGKINPEPGEDSQEPTNFEFAESTPREQVASDKQRMKELTDRSKVRVRQGRNHEEEVSKQILRPHENTVVYSPFDATEQQPIYDRRNLFSRKQEQLAKAQQAADEARALQAMRSGTKSEETGVATNPLVMKILGNLDSE